MDSVLTK